MLPQPSRTYDRLDLLYSFCIPETARRNYSFTLPNPNSFQLGPMLEFQYHLLEHVLQYLSSIDLRSASLVNETWESAAQREWRRRDYATSICCTYDPIVCQVYYSEGFGYENESLFMLVTNTTKIGTSTSVCLHHLSGDILRRITFNRWITEEICFAKQHYCIVACQCVSLGNRALNTTMYCGLSIPFIPNVRTAMFRYNLENTNQPHVPLEDYEQIVCLLVLTHRRSRLRIENLMSRMLEWERLEDVAVGGGVIDGARVFPRHDIVTTDVLCIGFFKHQTVEADFNAYSTVIPGNQILNPRYFTIEIFRLRNWILRKHGIIFLFWSRQKAYSSLNPEFEINLFQNTFPHYIVLSVQVNGEIGWNTRNTTQDTDEPAPLNESELIKQPRYHTGSTAVVLVTWGNRRS